MRQLYIDPNTRDLVVQNFNLRLTTGNTEALAQKIEARLLLFRGEWFLDQSAGVPYVQRILGKTQVDIADVNGIFRSTILETEGVAEIVSFTTDYGNAARTYSITFEVRVESGETANGGVVL